MIPGRKMEVHRTTDELRWTWICTIRRRGGKDGEVKGKEASLCEAGGGTGDGETDLELA